MKYESLSSYLPENWKNCDRYQRFEIILRESILHLLSEAELAKLSPIKLEREELADYIIDMLNEKIEAPESSNYSEMIIQPIMLPRPSLIRLSELEHVQESSQKLNFSM
ncbi:unnamed protein product [Blepharisma stoltei]|uniref:Uncharacterized protein n=1 Tax=Blepharisma stoltei TaxID=1481888 RepID=A0AAU9KH52_9CILI|nr:unnamed protein product [Blepharisma stoltei]